MSELQFRSATLDDVDLIVALVMVGLLKGGTPHGGYWGIEEGPYAYQHGAISLVMQLAGFALCLTPLQRALVWLDQRLP